jgi:hypothetical protein
MGGVVPREMGIRLRVAEVVDRDDLDLVRALDSNSARRMLRPMRP